MYIVCPQRILDVFRHLIVSFKEELDLEKIVIDNQHIFSLKNKNIILFGAQELCKFPEYISFLSHNNVYLYNTEQLPSTNWDYMINVSKDNIKEWWDYSTINIDYLKDKLNKPFKHIYFGYSTALDIRPIFPLDKSTITFFGTHNQRRWDICSEFYEKIKPYNITLKYNASGKLVNEVYDNYISRHCIYFNVHYYVPSILEIVRIVPLLSQGHLVISEHSNDKELDYLFSPYIIWYEDIMDNIPLLLQKIKSHDNEKLKNDFKSNLNFNTILKNSNVFDLI
jgi:hypothetical protein